MGSRSKPGARSAAAKAEPAPNALLPRASLLQGQELEFRARHEFGAQAALHMGALVKFNAGQVFRAMREAVIRADIEALRVLHDLNPAAWRQRLPARQPKSLLTQAAEIAAPGASMRILEALIKAYPDLALVKDGLGATSLMVAAANRAVPRQALAALLAASDPLARDHRGSTALMRAVGAFNEKAVDLLLPQSDPRARRALPGGLESPRGVDALMMAAMAGHVGIARKVLALSKSPAAKGAPHLGDEPRTAAQLADAGGHPEIAAMIRDKAAMLGAKREASKIAKGLGAPARSAKKSAPRL